MAVQSNYEDLWKKVKDLDEKRIAFRIAVKLVDSIYAKENRTKMKTKSSKL